MVPCWPHGAWAATWNLANGMVALPPDSFTCGAERISSPELAGSGGSGAVFAARRAGSLARVALKVSWAGPAAVGVRHEAEIYHRLGHAGVPYVPRLLAACEYATLGSAQRTDGRLPDLQDRVVLVLDPFVEAAVSSFEGLDARAADRAAAQLGAALAAVLAAGVASTDVQVLIDPSSGDLRLVDLSEAILLATPLSFLQLATARGFCAEAAAIVPAEQREAFTAAVRRELMLRRGGAMDVELAEAVVEVLDLSG